MGSGINRLPCGYVQNRVGVGCERLTILMIMEDYVDKLIYLVVGIVYFLIKNSNDRSVDHQPGEDHPANHPSAPTSSVGPPSTWDREAPQAPLTKVPLQRIGLESGSLHPGHTPPAAQTTQQPTDREISRTLCRYSGWKKAVIMSEIIQPRY